MNQLELATIKALSELQVPKHVRGYAYIKTAMKLLNGKHEQLYNVTHELYPNIAKEHNTIPSSVERGIRHALEISTADDATKKNVLGTARKLTNAEFLATLYEVLQVRMAQGKEAAV